MRTPLLAAAGLLLFTVGCEPLDGGFDLNLGNLDPVTIALVVIAYLANSRGHLAGIAKTALKILRKLGVLPPEDAQESADAREIVELLNDLLIRFRGKPETQDDVLKVLRSVVTEPEKGGGDG